MGKTKDLFKKIRDTKGTFYAKMGSIKDRSGMDLTEAENHYVGEKIELKKKHVNICIPLIFVKRRLLALLPEHI